MKLKSILIICRLQVAMLPTFIIKCKGIFQLDVRYNKVIIPPLNPSSRTPFPSTLVPVDPSSHGCPTALPSPTAVVTLNNPLLYDVTTCCRLLELESLVLDFGESVLAWR